MKGTLLTYGIIVILIISFSCNNNQSRHPDDIFPELISINPSDALADSFCISEIATKVEYIPLETNDSSLMDTFSDFAISKDFFFIKHNLEIFLFDKNGKFVTSLFRAGKGPEETFASCFAIDDIKKCVYVFEGLKEEVKIFGFDGTLINTLKKPINNPENRTWSIGYFNDNLFVATAQSPNVKYLYSCFDLKSDSIIVLYKNYRGYNNSQINKEHITVYDYHYQINTSNILFKERYCDTIFSVNKNLISEPKYIVDLGNKKLSWEDWRDNGMFWDFANGAPSGYAIQSFVETKSFMFFVLYSLKESVVFSVYNKDTGIVKSYKAGTYDPRNNQVIAKNDLDNMIPIPIMSSKKYLIFHDECLYCVIEAKDFSAAYKSASTEAKKGSDYLRKMAVDFNNISEFENPVIIKIYLR
jgi:hypothetical protein